MANKVYIFDVDGTLTPSRKRMNQKFQKFFMDWAETNPFYLVTGSDLPKTLEQLPEEIVQKAKGVFCCCGNEYLIPRDGDYEVVYSHKFDPPSDLIDYLNKILDTSKYHHRAGNHIENRGSLLNFSVVGRNCSVNERLNYFMWDETHNERKQIVDYIKEEWPTIDASRGGQISVDIHPLGRDKSQVVDFLDLPVGSTCIFFGDRTTEGGNDYPLARIINGYNKYSHRLKGKVYQVSCWEDTLNHLKEKVNA